MFVAIYMGITLAVTVFGVWAEALVYHVIPRLMGDVAMQAFTIFSTPRCVKTSTTCEIVPLIHSQPSGALSVCRDEPPS